MRSIGLNSKKSDIYLTNYDIVHQIDNVQGKKSMGMVIYKRKSMEYFDILAINNPYYQSVVCQFPYGIVCFVYINPKINNARLNDIIEMLSVYSMKENFVSLIGDLNIQSEFGIDTPRKLMDIFNKLSVNQLSSLQHIIWVVN